MVKENFLKEKSKMSEKQHMDIMSELIYLSEKDEEIDFIWQHLNTK